MRNQFINPHPQYSPEVSSSDPSHVTFTYRYQAVPRTAPSSFPIFHYLEPPDDLNKPHTIPPHETNPIYPIQSHSPHPKTQTPIIPPFERALPLPCSQPSNFEPRTLGRMSSFEDSSCAKCKELAKLVESLEKKVQMLIVQIDKPISLNGTLMWKISEVTKNNLTSPNSFLESTVFYTASDGYKLQGCVYLNGDGEATGKCISVYITLLRGEFDGLLNWPFLFPVTIVLIDQSLQGLDVSKTFQPTRTSSCFRQPMDDIKRPSGLPDFFELSKMKDPHLVDDTMYLKFIVHTSD